jgi:glutamyl-tRNA reductase
VLPEVDLVVASTGAEEPILTRQDVKAAMAHRRRKPMLIVDLGVPRNVEGAVGKLSNVFLHDIDSLEHLIEHNLRRRREDVPRVQQILGEELGRFHDWHRGLEVEPVIAGMQKRAEAIRRQEVARALAHFPEATHEQLEQLTRALVRKILHHPSNHLRRADDLDRLDLVRELFHLDEEEA